MIGLIPLMVFAGFAASGVYSIIENMRRLRAQHSFPDTLLSWSERPRADFRADFPGWCAINLHRYTGIGIGLAEVALVLSLRPLASWPDLQAGALNLFAGVTVILAISISGYLWGALVGGPVAGVIGGDRHYAVSDAGLHTLGHVTPWIAFNDFSFDAGSGMIFLWSASLPGAVAFAFKPATAEQRQQLLGILQAHLATRHEPPQLLRRYSFPLIMALFCTLFILAVVLLIQADANLGLIVIPLLLWLFLASGSSLMMRMVYGGKARPARTAAG